MQIRLYRIDTFTSRPFGGNPAAVCPLENWLDESLLRSIAVENNQPATAFFVPKDGEFEIRWFTPSVELELCGHGTMASSYVLLKILEPTRRRARFASRGGLLDVFVKEGRPVLDFPALPLVRQHDPSIVAEALGATPLELWEADRAMAIFESEKQIRALAPDTARVAALPFHSVIATAPAERGSSTDFVSRFFAPKIGVAEDQVTGSSHCVLTPYWAKRLGKANLFARQLSARGGELWLEDRGARVHLSGDCVAVAKGTIAI
jgi:PhzF family phenazine biosynthesis protein